MQYFNIVYDHDFETPIAVTIDLGMASDIVIEMLMNEGKLSTYGDLVFYDGMYIRTVDESELRSKVDLTDEDVTKIIEDHALFL